MATNSSQLVHEDEAQRRHARVKIPAKLLIKTQGKTNTFDILDISVSGFNVQTPPGFFQGDSAYKGLMHFKLNKVEFRLPISFVVVHKDHDGKKTGCSFDELGSDQVSLLHLFIGKYISGELVMNGDILSTLSRDNFTAARSKPKQQALRGWRRVRAVAGTVVAACVGVGAFGLIASGVHAHYFTTQAIFAVVDIDREVIEAPLNGYVDLISAVGTVEKGKPIAEISSPAMAYLEGTAKQLSGGEELSSILPQQFHSVVKSPCDGKILESDAADQTYVKKGDLLYTLVKAGEKPFIRAAFKYADADFLPAGREVTLRFPGTTESFIGIIEDIYVDSEGKSDQIIAVIRPDAELSIAQLQKPVFVSVSETAKDIPLVSSSFSRLTSLKATLAKDN